MAMVPFFSKFPELGPRETRIALVLDKPGAPVPPGEYGFFEFYCTERDCDCRRVLIHVVTPDTGWDRVWASISWGWESLDFYRQWSHGLDPREVKGPYLDPLNPQSEHAEALLSFFEQIIASEEYVDRLRRHYRMFRDVIDEEHRRAGHRAIARANRRQGLPPRHRRRPRY